MSPKVNEENHSFGHNSPSTHRYEEGANGSSAASMVPFDRTGAADPPAEGNNIGTPDSHHSSSSSVNLDNQDTFAEGNVCLQIDFNILSVCFESSHLI